MMLMQSPCSLVHGYDEVPRLIAGVHCLVLGCLSMSVVSHLSLANTLDLDLHTQPSMYRAHRRKYAIRNPNMDHDQVLLPPTLL